jgi:uncharacterized protein DUF4412
MKRMFPILMFTVVSSAFAGLTYKTQSNTTGMQSVSIVGRVTVDGSRMRMDVAKGDNMIFKDNSIVLSADGGKTMSVFDPSTKNYYDIQLDQLLGNASSAFKGLGDMVKVSFDNPQVSVRQGGDGGKIEGYPTRKYILDASYDMNIDAMGQKMTSHLTMNTESWTTEELASEMSSFLQVRGMRTGVESLDKLIEAQSNAMRGFPLKQVSTVHVSQGTNDMTMTTTATVTNIEKKNIDASVFTVPSGYTKVDDPVTRMLKQLKQ